MTEPTPFSRPFNPRTFGMLVFFAVLICATVILADKFSPRDRYPVLLTATAPTTSR
jgi:hypothetical protein